MEPTWSQIIAVVSAGALWLSAVGLALWYMWVYDVTAVRTNKVLRLTEGLSVAKHKERIAIFTQAGVVGMVAVPVGVLINVASSFFLLNNRLALPELTTPYMCIAAAIVIVEFVGIGIALFLTRPEEHWLTDLWTLSATIEQANIAGRIEPARLSTFEERFRKLQDRADDARLYTTNGLSNLGLRSEAAEREWPAAADHKPAEWSRTIRDELSWRQSTRWLVRRHWFMVTLAGLCLTIPLAILLLTELPRWMALGLYGMGIATYSFFPLLAWPAIVLARRELVLANRFAVSTDFRVDGTARTDCPIRDRPSSL